MPVRVSVVIATYNRSDILPLAIKSALAQTLENLEVLVVGDACTDDTQQVVAAFADSRVRFHNRTSNHGEQSAPNNDGAERAQGELLAFLNQDDLWLPDHLERATAELERGSWDGTISAAARLDQDGAWSYVGPTRPGEIPPHRNYPCSSWLVKRVVFANIGGFRDARALRQAPSAEWLERALRAGCRLGAVTEPSLVLVPSGCRADSYSKRNDRQHLEAYRMVADAGGRERLLRGLVLGLADRREQPTAREVGSLAYRRWVAPLLFRFTGRTLGSQLVALKYPRKGSYLQHLRRVRGLGPLPTLDRKTNDDE